MDLLDQLPETPDSGAEERDYAEIPPFGAPPLPPAAPPVQRAESDGDAGPLDAPDDEGDDDEDLEVADDAGEDEEEVFDEKTEVGRLKAQLRAAEERAAQAEAYEQQFAEQQRASRQQQAQAYWDNALGQAEYWFQSQEAQIYAEAEQSMNPVAYVQQRMGMLNTQRTNWLRDFHASREQAYYQFAMEQALPNWVREVAEHFDLDVGYVPELMEYPPDLIPREAEKIANRLRNEKARERKKQQDRRKRQRQQMAGSQVHTGVGSGINGKVEPGSDEHYNSLPWVRR